MPNSRPSWVSFCTWVAPQASRNASSWSRSRTLIPRLERSRQAELIGSQPRPTGGNRSACDQTLSTIPVLPSDLTLPQDSGGHKAERERCLQFFHLSPWVRYDSEVGAPARGGRIVDSLSVLI